MGLYTGYLFVPSSTVYYTAELADVIIVKSYINGYGGTLGDDAVSISTRRRRHAGIHNRLFHLKQRI